jgi:hypothetical protein
MFVSWFECNWMTDLDFSWLIDVGKNSEGLQVLIDLHGGDPNNAQANAEYAEIKDFVDEIVSSLR